TSPSAKLLGRGSFGCHFASHRLKPLLIGQAQDPPPDRDRYDACSCCDIGVVCAEDSNGGPPQWNEECWQSRVERRQCDPRDTRPPSFQRTTNLQSQACLEHT